MDGAKIRVVIADDHPIVRRGLSAVLEDEPDMAVIAQAPDRDIAVQLCREQRPDVLVMDLRMPGLPALDAVRILGAEDPIVRVVVLTTYVAEEEVVRLLQAGIQAYVLKNSYEKDLVQAVRAAHAGEQWIEPTVAERLGARAGAARLTAREIELLRLVARGDTNEELASTLHISKGTVKVHVSNILGKLGVTDRTKAVHAAIQLGFIDRD
jgi:two-component system, NarL family, response regulator